MPIDNVKSLNVWQNPWRGCCQMADEEREANPTVGPSTQINLFLPSVSSSWDYIAHCLILNSCLIFQVSLKWVLQGDHYAGKHPWLGMPHSTNSAISKSRQFHPYRALLLQFYAKGPILFKIMQDCFSGATLKDVTHIAGAIFTHITDILDNV